MERTLSSFFVRKRAAYTRPSLQFLYFSYSLVNDPIAEEAAVVAEVELDEQPKPWIVADEQVLADEQVRAIKHFWPTNVNFYKGEDTTPRITSSV